MPELPPGKLLRSKAQALQEILSAAMTRGVMLHTHLLNLCPDLLLMTRHGQAIVVLDAIPQHPIPVALTRTPASFRLGLIGDLGLIMMIVFSIRVAATS